MSHYSYQPDGVDDDAEDYETGQHFLRLGQDEQRLTHYGCHPIICIIDDGDIKKVSRGSSFQYGYGGYHSVLLGLCKAVSN